MTGGPAQMHEFQKNEIALWKRIVVKAKVPLQCNDSQPAQALQHIKVLDLSSSGRPVGGTDAG
jgi:hypothetical protein